MVDQRELKKDTTMESRRVHLMDLMKDAMMVHLMVQLWVELMEWEWEQSKELGLALVWV
jgi:hypothetical protein